MTLSPTHPRKTTQHKEPTMFNSNRTNGAEAAIDRTINEAMAYNASKRTITPKVGAKRIPPPNMSVRTSMAKAMRPAFSASPTDRTHHEAQVERTPIDNDTPTMRREHAGAIASIARVNRFGHSVVR